MGLFKSPSLPIYKPTPVTVTPQPVVEQEIEETTEDQARDVVRRASRGRGSTIKTSFRGVLSQNNALAPQRKNLLGE